MESNQVSQVDRPNYHHYINILMSAYLAYLEPKGISWQVVFMC